jgi:hypothetical protein
VMAAALYLGPLDQDVDHGFELRPLHGRWGDTSPHAMEPPACGSDRQRDV